MEDIKVISGNTEQEVWSQLQAELFSDDVLNYNVLLKLDGKEVLFYMDIDLGGGFEGGFEFMQFKAPLAIVSLFRFALHDKDFVDTVRKFFGMMDVEIGYQDLDQHLIIKTNDEEKVRPLFADAGIREVFTQLNSFDLGIHTYHPDGNHTKQPFLELNINHVISDSAEFRKVLGAFYTLLSAIETIH